jgi:hypothetical protein
MDAMLLFSSALFSSFLLAEKPGLRGWRLPEPPEMKNSSESVFPPGFWS